MMVLLSLLAAGLLGLSSITLRSSTRGAAMLEARANARLALMLALNDLQVHAGPDTRITAPAGTLGENVGQPELTGVWNARALDPESPPQASDFSKEGKSEEFRRWLVSSTDQEQLREQDFGSGSFSNGEILLSDRYSADGQREFRAERVELANGRLDDDPSGRFAFAVFDENTKARVDLGVMPPHGGLASETEKLGVGSRPGVDRIGTLDYLPDEDVDLSNSAGLILTAKMISLASAEMGHEAPTHSYGRHFRDLTPYSLGLLTDVTRGGFKADLNLLAEQQDRPAPYGEGSRMYETAFGLDFESSPTWAQALDFANLFNLRNSRRKAYLTGGTGGTPTLAASAPGDWSASTSVSGGVAVPNPEPPTSPVLLPSIAKVQMVYSLHVHDLWYFNDRPGTTADDPTSQTWLSGPYNKEWKNKAENQWDKTNWSYKNKDRAINYQMWVFCTPIITLHNPYNVALEIPGGDLTIDFVNVPFGMRFYVNGTAQTADLVPYTEMFYWNDKGRERRYTMTFFNKSESGGNIEVDERADIRLLPGEVKVFSPYMDPEVRYTDRGGENEWYNVFNEHTFDIKAIPGWLGEGIGYGQDQPLPDKFRPLKLNVGSNGMPTTDGRMMQDGMPLTGDEMIEVDFAPIPAEDEDEKRFTIEMTLNRANRNRSARSVVLDFDYEVTDGLQSEMLGDDGVIRWPKDGPIQAIEMRDHWTRSLAQFSRIRPFALLSAYAKTTHGGVDTTNDDGRYPAKPWIFNNHTGAVSSQKIVSQHPSHHSHEINLVRLGEAEGTSNAIEIQPGTDRGNFVTGHTSFNGRKFGTMFEVPLGPIQSPVTLNGANPAAGYYLPRFTAPIGNSFAHPVMPTGSLMEQVNGQTYADHCYLLNSVFFDGFYCSGIQRRGGPFGSGETSDSLAGSFFGDGVPLADSRLLPHLADGATADEAVTTVTAADGFGKVGAYQLVRGAFNVNSTSVEAWKAVLSAMSGEDARVSTIPLWSDMSEGVENLDEAEDEGGARFSRLRLPNAQPDAGDPDALWHASRDLDNGELDALATEIVGQVRERGPFLSMSEFVNRQLGTSSELTLAGALQTAINEAGINDNADLGGYEIGPAKLAGLELETPEALTGNSADGATGVLTQADILAMLGNSATVRSDTFVVRGYGESLDAGGGVVARAWCEAVVQRMPEYLDPADAATVIPGDLTSETNKRFGRRFDIVSFRWLTQEEV